MTDFRALCAELIDKLADFRWAAIEAGDGWHPDTAALIARARASLADEPAVPEGRDLLDFARNQEPWKTWMRSGGCLESAHCEIADLLSAVLARWGNPAPQPPADGEVADVVRWLRSRAGIPASPDFPAVAPYLTRAAELLQRQTLVPVAVSDALIKAECALSDIAEGEPMTDEGDPLQWAERRCADTLAIIRPTMRQHKIRTSELPPVPAHALLQCQALVPAPVSERLPGPEDFDEKGRCWCFGEGEDMVGWTLQQPSEFYYYSATHWLPAHALPIPQQQENTND